jgi:hypothetical protein
MPVFRDIRSTTWTGENGLLGIEWRQRAGFSLDGKCAVRFQGSHKANANAIKIPGFVHRELTSGSALENEVDVSHKPVSG